MIVAYFVPMELFRALRFKMTNRVVKHGIDEQARKMSSAKCLVKPAAVLVVSLILTVSGRADDSHVDANSVRWKAPPVNYLGADFTSAFRYKTLIGGPLAPVHGRGVLFGEAEWAPGAIYVGHAHPAPEIYYIVSGEAEWTIDGRTFKATAGTAVYTKPNAVHRMVNTGKENLKTVWMWWGKPTVLNQFPEIVEPIEEQPARATFSD